MPCLRTWKGKLYRQLTMYNVEPAIAERLRRRLECLARAIRLSKNILICGEAGFYTAAILFKIPNPNKKVNFQLSVLYCTLSVYWSLETIMKLPNCASDTKLKNSVDILSVFCYNLIVAERAAGLCEKKLNFLVIMPKIRKGA